MNSCPHISDWALHVCLSLKELFLRYHGKNKEMTLEDEEVLSKRFFRKFSHFVTYLMYSNVFKHAMKCSLSHVTFKSQAKSNNPLCPVPQNNNTALSASVTEMAKIFQNITLPPGSATWKLQLLKLYISTTSISCSYYFGILLCRHLKVFLSNAAVFKMHMLFQWFVARGSGTTVSAGKSNMDIPLHCPPSHTHSFPPCPTHTRHKADWLDLTRENIGATVATVGPADHSSLLTMDTAPLLVVGMAVSIQHPLGKINQKPDLQSIIHQQRQPAFPQQQRTSGPLATQHSSKKFSWGFMHLFSESTIQQVHGATKMLLVK